MADSDHSSSDGLSVDSRDTSQDSKLEFSEDEETLIIRMYNLVGERSKKNLRTGTDKNKCNKNEVNIQTWSIDSGCSNHMSAAASVFENLDLSYKSRVKVANGQYVSVEGKGEVKIETLAGIRKFECVLYVPKIDQNLISVGQLLEDRHSLLFLDDKCMIKDDQGTLLFSTKMSNRCFSFEKQLEHQSNSTGRDSAEEKGSLKMAVKDDECQTMLSRGSVDPRETHLVELSLQDVGSLYCDETCKSIERKRISSAALVPDESVDSLFYDAKGRLTGRPLGPVCDKLTQDK